MYTQADMQATGSCGRQREGERGEERVKCGVPSPHQSRLVLIRFLRGTHSRSHALFKTKFPGGINVKQDLHDFKIGAYGESVLIFLTHPISNHMMQICIKWDTWFWSSRQDLVSKKFSEC